MTHDVFTFLIMFWLYSLLSNISCEKMVKSCVGELKMRILMSVLRCCLTRVWNGLIFYWGDRLMRRRADRSIIAE